MGTQGNGEGVWAKWGLECELPKVGAQPRHVGATCARRGRDGSFLIRGRTGAGRGNVARLWRS